MPYTDIAPEEVSRRGEAIYARDIRAQVEPENTGKFVVIDIAAGA